MRVGALAQQRASHPQPAHEDGQHGGRGQSGDAEDQPELPEPDRLVDQRAETGAEKQRGESTSCSVLSPLHGAKYYNR
jgi:hypothetical protein